MVVITWLSSWVGAGFAREYAEQWYDLLLIARNKKKTDIFVKYLTVLYPNINISSMIFDVTEKWQLEKIQTALWKIKKISTLINCFGYTSHKYFNKQKVRTPKDIITIQDTAAMKISHTMLEIMKNKKQGNIVHVSSLVSLLAIGDNPISATSKIFLNKTSDQLHHIKSDYNISIQTLCPRLTDIDFGKIGKQNFQDKAMGVRYIVKKSILCKNKWNLVCIPRFVNKVVLTTYNILPRTRSHKLFKRLFD